MEIVRGAFFRFLKQGVLLASLAFPIQSLQAQVTTRTVLSRAPQALGNADSNCPAMSGDGRRTVFESEARNLVPGDTNRRDDLFLFDSTSNALRRLSQNAAGVGQQGGQNPVTCSSAISRDGSTVVYATDGIGLVPEAVTNVSRIYVFNLTSGAIELVVPASLTEGAFFPSVSGDGNRIVFISSDPLLVPSADGKDQVFLTDRTLGTTRLLSVDVLGGPADGQSTRAAISADGEWVAFESRATNLKGAPVPGGGINDQVFLVNVSTGQHILASRSVSGPSGNRSSRTPSISADGKHVAFFSEATDLTASDTNQNPDVFVYERESDTVELITVTSEGVPFRQFSEVFIHAISSDGNLVVFRSQDPARKRFGLEVFVRDRRNAKTYLATFSDLCGSIRNDRSAGVIAPDVPVVALSSGRDFVRAALQIVRVGLDVLQTISAAPANLISPSADICNNSVTLAMTPFALGGAIEGATILYETRVVSSVSSLRRRSFRALSVSSAITKKSSSKRSTLTLKRLPPGTYRATYRVRIKAADGSVQLSPTSQRRRFKVR